MEGAGDEKTRWRTGRAGALWGGWIELEGGTLSIIKPEGKISCAPPQPRSNPAKANQ